MAAVPFWEQSEPAKAPHRIGQPQLWQPEARERVVRIDLFRVKVKAFGFSTTYQTAGTAKHRISRTRPFSPWVGLWVEKIA